MKQLPLEVPEGLLDVRQCEIPVHYKMSGSHEGQL